ncbi:MAG TPA: hypothetical protein VFQ84_13460 [Arenimonas sp.]|uniref:hypothetical protein n=1 Tax=Arenimonas sp. TaxID=1872635 RepID=UPI002D7E8E95|nr:hypothetical protein [Arenimonas sp.]HEU0154340.1 hypothetical protein [Arenimonas sp.]
MASRFMIRLSDPALARGDEPGLSFQSSGAEGFAGELEAALRTPALFERWKGMQDEPDDVEDALGVVDPDARVTGQQRDLKIELEARTSLPGSVFRHRMRLLAGSHWELVDVRAG